MRFPRGGSAVFSVACWLALLFQAASARSEEASSDESGWKGKTVVVSLSSSDLETGRSVRELGRMLEQAEEESAAAVIFDLDVGEPAPWSTQQRVLNQLAGVEIPTFAFVNPSATGPGALIALASEAIYLSPSGIIGGAGLEDATDDEEESASNLSQQRSVLKARARSLARLRGHRPEIAEAFIDGSAAVEVDGVTISAEGDVLTLTAEEAVRRFDGEPLLAVGVVGSIRELIEAEGLPEEFVRLTPREFGESFNRERLARIKEDVEESGASPAGAEVAEGEAEEPPIFGRKEEDSYEGKIVVLEVGEDTLATGKASFEFIDRTLKKAELDGASAVIFDMDTPGGFAWYTEGLVLNSLQSVTYPTYTFVNSRAESAGAIVALGTDHIYMRPAATIGSALVVSGMGQDLSESMSDKVTQMIIGTVRNIAELNGHNPDVAEAFVTRDKEVKVGGEVIHEAGHVLNLNTIRATEEVGGRPLLAKGVARSIGDIVEQENLQGEVLRARPLGMEAFAHWAQKLSVLLIMIGLAGAYMELNSPGFGLPGLASVCAFSLFFFGNYLAGNLAGYELAVLLVLGLVLIGAEIFVFPGAVVPGVAGAALVMAALGFAMVDRVDFEWKWSGLPTVESWFSIFRGAFTTVAVGLAGALAAILLGMRLLPETRLGSRMILKQAVAGGASIGSGDSANGGNGAKAETYIGLEGETKTDLLPSGKGEFGGRLFDVVSEGEFIGRGEPIRITRHEGSRIVVSRT
ncbi:MAG: NfeD family protein [Verrucomicrobiales bacterium]